MKIILMIIVSLFLCSIISAGVGIYFATKKDDTTPAAGAGTGTGFGGVDVNGKVKPTSTETPPPPPPMSTNIKYIINDVTNAVEVKGNVTKSVG
jgi:hypothetical protein